LGARNAEIAFTSLRSLCTRTVAVVALLAGAQRPAVGQGPEPSEVAAADTGVVVSLPPIEVSAARPVDPPSLRRAIGFARAYDVTGSHGRLRTVADVLTTATGVHVREFGGVGGFSTVSIRGSSSSQVAVYLDGVPLNSAQFGVVNFCDLPIEAIERIEVYRGAAPLGFDSPGGGVVHLVTGSAPGRWLRASAGQGSFGTGRADLGAGWHKGETALMAVGQVLRGRGDFTYVDDNATPFNAGDDTLRARINNDLTLTGLTAQAQHCFGPLGLSLTHDHLSKDQGTPGNGANPAEAARFRTQRDLGNLRLWWNRRRSLSAGAPGESPSLRVYVVGQRDRFSDRGAELGGVPQDNDNQTLRWGSQLFVPVTPVWGHAFELMADGRREQYAPRLNLPTPRELPLSSRDQATWGVADRWTTRGGRVSLAGSVTRQQTVDEFPGGSPYPGALPVPATQKEVWLTRWNGGGRVRLLPGIDLKGSVSRLERMPTFEELFGNVGGVRGNPRARPEQIDTRDLGLVALWTRHEAGRAWLPAWLDAQLSAYRSDAADLLVFMPAGNFQTVKNISAARLWGAEWSGRFAWAGGLSAELSWTRQWTRDEGEVAYWHGRELPGRPRDEASVLLNFARRGGQVGLAQHLVSANHLDPANLSPVPARALLDVHGALRTGPIEWLAEGKNLTDQHVEDFDGYPLPGRSFFFGARVTIDRKEIQP